MKVVLDTNILVSGLICSDGAPARILDLAAARLITPCYDDRILNEYREVLRRQRFGFAPTDIDELITMVDRFGKYIIAAPYSAKIPDPDDLPFLEVALSGGCAALITGNKRDFGKPSAGLPILSPVEFVDFFARSTVMP